MSARSQAPHPKPPEKHAFDAIRPARVYEQVVRQLQNRIVEHDLKPGDMLPPERELAAEFQVSRSSVRDAIRTLELMGLVKSRQGEGTVVRELSAESLVLPLSSVLVRKRELVAELLDVRKMLEPPLAARAALHVTDEQLAHLKEILTRQRQKMRRGEQTVEEDSEFHYTIALAAQNTVMLKVLDVLMDLLRDSRARTLQFTGRLQRSLRGHNRILRALSQRDPRAAEAAMRLHLKEIEQVLLRTMS